MSDTCIHKVRFPERGNGRGRERKSERYAEDSTARHGRGGGREEDVKWALASISRIWLSYPANGVSAIVLTTTDLSAITLYLLAGTRYY